MKQIMDSKPQLYVFLTIVSLRVVSACLDGECRELAFPSFYFFANKRLVNHNITTVKVRDMDACELRCYHEPNCVSINFNSTASAMGTYRCDLNNATHRGHDNEFVDAKVYLYRGADSACDRAHCENGGTCQSGFTDKGFRCLCPPGFMSAHCEQDVNECASGTHNCSHFAACNNTKGSFNCTCKQGFTGDGFNCTDIDECVTGTHNCSNDNVCNNTKGGFNCTCKAGFTGDGQNVTGKSCKDIKRRGQSQGDGMYWLEPDGGTHSNAFLAYCDMTSYGGGWTMCYTTDEYAKPKTEVTYNPNLCYGTDGYRTDCNNIPFTEIIFVDHQTGNKAYFKRKSNQSLTAAVNYGKRANTYGLWDGFGAMNSSYSYQLLICDHRLYPGFFVSGYTRNCYKRCHRWCGDRASPYFRTASNKTAFRGVAFNTNGYEPNVVKNRLMSVGLR